MTDDQQAAEAADTTEEKSAEVADQFAEADAHADPVDPPSVEQIAGEMGWVPQEKFKGPQDKWKPADRFILDGKSIQDRSSRELKEMRQTLDTVAKTSASILAEKLAEQRSNLAQQYAAAVERGDPDETWRAANAIKAIDNQAQTMTQPQRRPEPEAVEWTQQNARVMRDPIAAKRALAVCNEYATANYSTADQLAATEAIMRREFPHLFDTKAAPQVNGAQTRNAAPSTGGAKTARDMPKAAQDVAKDMVDRGVIPNVDAYAKNYFAEVEKRKQA